MREVEITEYKTILTELLIEVDRICRKHDIKYSLIAGTLLGAVRHHGFIPWDDDIDIAMPYEDYDKFAKVIQDYKYELNFIRIDEGHKTCFPYGKICNPKTVVFEGNLKPIEGYGAYIDVFPIINIPEKKAVPYNKYYKKYLTLYRLASYSMLTKYTKSNNLVKNFGRAVEFYFTRYIRPEWLVKKIMRDMVKINTTYCNSKKKAILWERFVYPSELFENQQEVEFEGHMFFGTNNPDAFLKEMFGDYMKLPPESERILKHGLKCFYK
ncbi:MAG: LicD family protein [Oliverpabstia sp.]|nr:LicD family protein [Oliverpabstia sp.]